MPAASGGATAGAAHAIGGLRCTHFWSMYVDDRSVVLIVHPDDPLDSASLSGLQQGPNVVDNYDPAHSVSRYISLKNEHMYMYERNRLVFDFITL